jgi:hypothetical protein
VIEYPFFDKAKTDVLPIAAINSRGRILVPRADPGDYRDPGGMGTGSLPDTGSLPVLLPLQLHESAIAPGCVKTCLGRKPGVYQGMSVAGES